ncbi:hypothetical protein ABZS83_06515 [Streptomyces sp. NPDC005426]|uniref:hypothetical protein n=1 Tax=unclassified Streptomyces TaxID=2593676 RepID=UPI0033AEB3DF
MTSNAPQPGTLRHTPVSAESGGQLVIENLDVPAEQCALFTVTYTMVAPISGDPAA